MLTREQLLDFGRQNLEGLVDYILLLQDQIQRLRIQIEKLEKRVESLEGQLRQNSHKPPSSDGLRKLAAELTAQGFGGSAPKVGELLAIVCNPTARPKKGGIIRTAMLNFPKLPGGPRKSWKRATR